MVKHKNLCPGCHENYTFGRPFIDHQYFAISLSDLCLGIEKDVLKRNNEFSL